MHGRPASPLSLSPPALPGNPRPAGPPPDRASLRDAALRHLARYASTEANLLRVLNRRIDRWARLAGDEADTAAARQAARQVVHDLAAIGAVNDAAYAESRARSLNRAGRSRRAVAAHLAAKGVDAETARAALPDDPEAELTAALRQARRKRIGPFAAGETDVPNRMKHLATMARAGFSQDIARRALAMPRADAEDRLAGARDD